MRHSIDYRVTSKISNDLPDITIEIAYADEFTDDSYVIRSEATKELGSKNIPFVVSKNEKEIGKLEMTERDVTGFFETMFAGINDADFKKEFYSKVFKPITEDVAKFFKLYDSLVIANGITVEGDIARMRVLSGIFQ